MRYLRRFNEAISGIEDNLQWVEDSLLELTDLGYNIEVRQFTVYPNLSGMKVTIEGCKLKSYGDRLLPISIGENLLTIDSYLREEGFVGYNPYDYDNEYSQSRYELRVSAFLKNIRSPYENELSKFVKTLDRIRDRDWVIQDINNLKAPFDSVSVSYFRPENKLDEAIDMSRLDIQDMDVRLDIQDILLELEECEIEYSIIDVNYWRYPVVDDPNAELKSHTCFKVNIKDNKDRFFRLEDIMDVILRLKDYLKETNFSIDIGIPNSDEYYPMDIFMEEFKGEELYHINLYIFKKD
jgi:hypothetical protein